MLCTDTHCKEAEVACSGAATANFKTEAGHSHLEHNGCFYVDEEGHGQILVVAGIKQG